MRPRVAPGACEAAAGSASAAGAGRTPAPRDAAASRLPPGAAAACFPRDAAARLPPGALAVYFPPGAVPTGYQTHATCPVISARGKARPAPSWSPGPDAPAGIRGHPAGPTAPGSRRPPVRPATQRQKRSTHPPPSSHSRHWHRPRSAAQAPGNRTRASWRYPTPGGARAPSPPELAPRRPGHPRQVCAGTSPPPEPPPARPPPRPQARHPSGRGRLARSRPDPDRLGRARPNRPRPVPGTPARRRPISASSGSPSDGSRSATPVVRSAIRRLEVGYLLVVPFPICGVVVPVAGIRLVRGPILATRLVTVRDGGRAPLGRNEARRRRPPRGEVLRPVPAVPGRTLRFFGWSRLLITILTRPVALSVHLGPQFSQISDEMSRSSPIPTTFVRVVPAVRCYPLRASVYRGLFCTRARPNAQRADPEPAAQPGPGRSIRGVSSWAWMRP